MRAAIAGEMQLSDAPLIARDWVLTITGVSVPARRPKRLPQYLLSGALVLALVSWFFVRTDNFARRREDAKKRGLAAIAA